MKTIRLITLALPLAVALAGCAEQPMDIEDGEDDSIAAALDGDKADAFGAREDSVEAARALLVANSYPKAKLVGLGLSTSVAGKIVTARTAERLETLTALDAVPSVGATVYAALLREAAKAKLLQDAIRVPLSDSECAKNLTAYNAQAKAAGLAPFPRYVWVDATHGYADQTDPLVERITALDVAAKTNVYGVCQYGTVSNFNVGGRTACYVGDGAKIADVVAARTDDLVSDQYVMWGWRFGADKWLDDNIVETEMPTIWKGYKSSYKSVLIVASTTDSGDVAEVDNLYPCR